jgi:class 3 adenylate cyclase
MSSLPPESRKQDLDGLIRELTDKADWNRGNALALARRYHLDPEFVSEVLEVLEAHQQTEALRDVPESIAEALRAFAAFVRRIWEALAHRTLYSATVILGVAFFLTSNAKADPIRASSATFTIWGIAAALISSLLFLRRQISDALVISGIYFVGNLVWHFGPSLGKMMQGSTPVQAQDTALTCVAAGAIFFAITGIWAVWDWLSANLAGIDPVARLGRQQMIERLMHIERLVARPGELRLPRRWLQSKIGSLLRSISVIMAFALGFLSRTMVMVEGNAGGPGLSYGFLAAGAAFVGYLALTPWHAILAGFLYTIGFAAPDAFLAKSVSNDVISSRALPWLCVLLALGGSLAAQVQRGKDLLNRHKVGERATLIAEVVRIQRRLESRPAHVCVMVVDVAGSTGMKDTVNPLLAEYSFRAYQRWIEETCIPFGGRVHSTAGDGAVLAFDSCKRGVAAARRLCETLGDFNSSLNQLPVPFKIRVGVHVDTVAGDLRDVQFSKVIDVAAHTEGVSPINGVALTEPVARRLQGESLKAHGEIDGFRVFTLAEAA